MSGATIYIEGITVKKEEMKKKAKKYDDVIFTDRLTNKFKYIN
jgi:adenylosuccinate lyase